MCGILGIVGKPITDEPFALALTKLAHRGPDDVGIYQTGKVSLGLRRLAILDLSEAGHQPMCDEDSGAVITYNGEIFNYLELRADLERLGWKFKSRTDTEVVLKAVLQWGEAALQKFNGMWAFAVWLPKTGQVFFARDRFGVKPFYYIFDDGMFAFASEPKALLSLFPQYRRVDSQTLRNFLVAGELYTDGASFYLGIKTLLPSRCGTYDIGTQRVNIRQYWNYPNHSEVEPSTNDFEQFCDLLDNAVKLRLRSDVPLGITLSGGLDSTAVLAAAKQQGLANVTCFTSVYSVANRGESQWAKLAASRYGLAPVEVEAVAGAWLDTLRKIVWHMDGPGYSPAVFPLWNIMAEARKCGTLVVLEGQGADELFGGYAHHTVRFLISLVGNLLRTGRGSRDIFTTWRGGVETFGRKALLLWLMREILPFLVSRRRQRFGALSVLKSEFANSGATQFDVLSDKAPEGMDRLTQALWKDHSRKILPGLLHYGDAISMAHSVESRLPFMDHRLVEWVFARTAEIKIANGESKWLVRQYLRKRGQAQIAERKDKQGYPTPADEWLASGNGRIAKDILTSPGAKILQYADPKKIHHLINSHLEGNFNVGNHLYRLLTTELWLQQCTAGESIRMW